MVPAGKGCRIDTDAAHTSIMTSDIAYSGSQEVGDSFAVFYNASWQSNHVGRMEAVALPGSSAYQQTSINLGEGDPGTNGRIVVYCCAPLSGTLSYTP
jgi:hypothetical protein